MRDMLPGLSSLPNLHPLFVHLPVALWPTALLLAVAGFSTRRGDPFALARWFVFLALVTTVVAMVTGLFAEADLGISFAHHAEVRAHRNWMLAATIGGILTAGAVGLESRVRRISTRGLLLVLLVVTTGLILIGSDRGVLLVYGRGAGVSIDAARSAR